MVIKWNREFNLGVYQPKPRIKVEKEEVIHHAFTIGTILSKLGVAFTIAFFFFASISKIILNGEERLMDLFKGRRKVLVVKRRR